MRHGEAQPSAPGGDSERKLTNNGVQIVTKVAEALKGLGCAPSQIMHSPFARTTQSAKLVAEVLSVDDLVEEYALIPSGDPKMASSFIFNNNASTLLVVSHMPLLPSVLKIFVGARVDFATADVARVLVYGGDRAEGSAILKALMPHQLLLKTLPDA